MTADIVARCRRAVREAEQDGMSPVFVARLRANLERELAVYGRSRQPGTGRAVADLAAEEANGADSESVP